MFSAREAPWRQALLYGLGGFLFLRFFVALLGVAVAWAFPMPPLPLSSPYLHGFVPTPGERSSPFLELWLRWDAPWYLSIAQSGYRAGDGSVAFFPLYPVLVGMLGRLLGGRYLWAGLLVSNLAAAAALVFLYRLAWMERAPDTARAAVEVVVAFPWAFFLVMPYAEPLFLLLSVASFYAWRKGRWLSAGLLGGLAALARPHGVLLFPALALAWLLERRPLRALLSLVPIPAGMLVFAAYASFLERAPFWRAQEYGWGHRWTWPWLAIWEGFQRLDTAGPAVLSSLFSIALVILPLAAGLRRLAPPYWVYAFLMLLLSVTRVQSEGVLYGLERLALTVFPSQILLGEFLSRRRVLWFLWRWLGLVAQAAGVIAFARWGSVW